jgi:hypothetical protein
VITWVEQDDGSQTTQFGQIEFHFPHFGDEFGKHTIKDRSDASLVSRVPVNQRQNNSSVLFIFF